MSLNTIATKTLTSSASSITFSGIPASWQDLMLVVTSNGTQISSFLSVQFNGDTTSKYINSYAYAGGYTESTIYTGFSAVRGNGALSITQIPVGQGLVNNSVTSIFNYKDTDKWKSFLVESADNPRQYYGISSGTWQSTSAINAIKIFPDTGSFGIGTSMTLYGVSA